MAAVQKAYGLTHSHLPACAIDGATILLDDTSSSLIKPAMPEDITALDEPEEFPQEDTEGAAAIPHYSIERPADTEDPNDYCLGGFHPVKLGDTLGASGRYRAVHRLGDGGYATVWLCRDEFEQKWRAIKILAAVSSNPDSPELSTAETFSDLPSKALLRQHIGSPLHYFWLDGINGCHLCAVMPFFGPPVADIYWWYGNHPALLKDICLQITKGLSFLHRRGICHGDLRPGNILFQHDNKVDLMSEEELLRRLGNPQPVRVVSSDGSEIPPHMPKFLVPKARMDYSSGLCSTRVVITDFGISYKKESPGQCTGIPTPYAAPEDIFRRSTLGPATDVWTLGCTIFEISTGLKPFREGAGVDQAVALIEDSIGPMPQPFRSAWKEEFNFECQNDENNETLFVTKPLKLHEYTESLRKERTGYANFLQSSLVKECYRLRITPAQAAEIAAQDYGATEVLPTFTSLPGEAEFEDRVDFQRNEKEMNSLMDLLRKMFKWQPEDRITAEDMLDHEWFGVWCDRRLVRTSRRAKDWTFGQPTGGTTER